MPHDPDIFVALARLESKLDQLGDDLHTLRVLVTGNGDTENSLVVKVDRLEQHAKRREFISQAAIGAAIAAVVTAVGSAVWPLTKG